MASPSNFAKPIIKFKRLDDLPNHGRGKPYTHSEVMQAMKVLHRMLHAQAENYGGRDSKLLQAGIAESKTESKLLALDEEMAKAYALLERVEDQDALARVIKHITAAIRQ